jgi:hypothetical protein
MNANEIDKGSGCVNGIFLEPMFSVHTSKSLIKADFEKFDYESNVLLVTTDLVWRSLSVIRASLPNA